MIRINYQKEIDLNPSSRRFGSLKIEYHFSWKIEEGTITVNLGGSSDFKDDSFSLKLSKNRNPSSRYFGDYLQEIKGKL